MTTLKIPTARVFKPLLEPSRYKGAHGGRSSGKSHFFAELLVESCMRENGLRAIGIREMQKDLEQSSKAIIEGKIYALGLQDHFRIMKNHIVTPGNGIIIFRGMQEYRSDSVKSLEAFKIAWVDEAQNLSEVSLELLRPTIRAPGSELWFSWNPTRRMDAVDKMLHQSTDPDAIVVQANWRDNPWWNETMEKERQKFLREEPERYGHIWEGEYASAFKGAYFAAGLVKAQSDGRIGRVAPDPILPIRAYFDIGGSGDQADATAIWIVQFVGQEIRVLDYIEGQGQVLGFYTEEMRRRGYERAICRLPHDGINANNFTGKRYYQHWRDAGFDATVIQNVGKGASMMRIEAVRRLFPQCWFNESTTEAGRVALGYYHEKRDADRHVGLGPDHDWSSHAADAFGLMALDQPRHSRPNLAHYQTQAIDDINPHGTFVDQRVFVEPQRINARHFPDAIEE